MKHWIKTVSLLFIVQASAQDIAVGTWRTHFSYQSVRILVTTEDKLFCAAENGLFSYDVQSQEVRKLSKLDGLSGAGITTMEYNSDQNVLLIGYSSGLVDLIYEDRIVAIQDIANSALEGDKRINDISSRDGDAFLGTGLGVIAIDLNRGQITENFVQIGANGSEVNVLEVLFVDNSLFILTDEGIQSGSLDQNLLDFNNWTMYPETSSFRNLTLFESKIYALSGSSLYELTNQSWTDTEVDIPSGADHIFIANEKLLTVASNTVFALNEGSFEVELTAPLERVNDMAFINGQYYFADELSGLQNENGDILSPVGPLSDTYSNIRALGNEVYAFHAPSIFSFDGSQVVDSFSLFSGGSWQPTGLEGFPNVTDVTLFNGTRFFSSLGYGLFDEENNQIIRDIPESNSGLDTLITSIDASNLLWLVGEGDQPVHFMNDQGEWNSYDAGSVFGSSFQKVDISETGIVWALKFDGELTVMDVDEAQIELLSRSDGLPSFVTDFDISIEDDVWLSSTTGPAFFSSASFVFFDSDAIRPTFENGLLFEDQQVNAVMTDGGNRIWFGTNRGLWVFSENTSEQIALFNESNSPLPSDVILDLAYNGSNGEVFIVTDRGMVSYRSASSIGSGTHRNVSIFPNPVRPSYSGMVGITGLARNVSVKITDMGGNLVKELVANGGTASWDLLDANGSSVVTGVYFFFSSTADGEDTFVGKLAVIR